MQVMFFGDQEMQKKSQNMLFLRHGNVMIWKRFLHYWPFVRKKTLVIGGLPSQRASNTCCGALLFSLFANRQLNKQWNFRWFETPWRSHRWFSARLQYLHYMEILLSCTKPSTWRHCYPFRSLVTDVQEECATPRRREITCNRYLHLLLDHDLSLLQWLTKSTQRRSVQYNACYSYRDGHSRKWKRKRKRKIQRTSQSISQQAEKPTETQQ